MRSVAGLVGLLVVTGCHESTDGIAPAKVTNIETDGNLASFSPIGCVDLAGVESTQTPADLYPAVRLCIDGDDLDRGARLFALAGVYGRFDMMRVRDESAHQAIAALQRENLGSLSSERAQAFQHHLAEKFAAASDALRELCEEIERVGPPRYEPIYMVQHGMEAFGQPGEGRSRTTDPAAGWDEALSGYLGCPKQSATED